MQPTEKRYATLFVLAAWAFPAAMGVVGLVHLTFDAHHHEAQPVAAAALALAHGHSHPLEAPDHGHDAEPASPGWRGGPPAGMVPVGVPGPVLPVPERGATPGALHPTPSRPPPQVLTSVLLL